VLGVRISCWRSGFRDRCLDFVLGVRILFKVSGLFLGVRISFSCPGVSGFCVGCPDFVLNARIFFSCPVLC
jgi:hypothetical protein